ncbi:MAG TPA: Rrf2 family transcriptional regulator [Spirochaetota bacterium]|jgi:Rrf2 family protein|nr:Rrf2 family transcriptional regulator [Spirochaetota bacterium]HPV41200.1 Rrf2 family transcriptional regulator [Spirochaetota bacterium]
MKLSTRTRYGIRALIDLARNIDDKPVSVKEIARRQNISTRYLENIFHELKNAGILGSSKGKGGGFYIAIPMKEITILSLIDILDGELAILDCLIDAGSCQNVKGCYTRPMWDRLNDEIRKVFEKVTIEDLFNTIEK